MDKKTALLTLLKNSFWITDAVKLKIIDQLDNLTEDQIDEIGQFLAIERDFMLANEDQILDRTQKILEIIGNDITENPDSEI